MKEREKIDNFIELFDDFKKLQQTQKMRGLNDFNIFTTVLKKHDEVRLHSRFLAFLLNPQANHYQGSLFLELFLEECEIDKGFFTNLDECEVYCEYENIDIYITDGNKHIIIENKIYAGDQKAQVKRYIEIINEENQDLKNDDLLVMYLSLNRNQPSTYSLCADEENCPDGFEINEKSIIGKGENQGRKYKFYNLSYKNEIAKWLGKSHQQIANITNLAVGITQYQEVIQKLYGTYKEKVMNLNEYLESKENKAELIKTMGEISAEYKELRKTTIKDFFEKSVKKLKEENLQSEGWEVIVKQEVLDKGQMYKAPLKIMQNKNSKVVIAFEFDKINYHDFTFGITISDKTIDLSKLQGNKNIIELLSKEKNLEYEEWLIWDYYCEDDIFDKIIGDGDEAVDKFVKDFIDIFDKYKEVVIECNKILDNEK